MTSILVSTARCNRVDAIARRTSWIGCETPLPMSLAGSTPVGRWCHKLETMLDPLHLRHKPPETLERPRELVVVCAPMHSNINLSRIVRSCGCCGISKVIGCGNVRIIEKIARDGAETVVVETHRTLEPVLKKLRAAGYCLVGLEQASTSERLYDYRFQRRSALILGSERQGLKDQFLASLDDIVEIPVYGLPYSHNVATAAAMAMYEYCRQFPNG